MKFKPLTFQIAAAALLAPVAVSFASPTPKASPATQVPTASAKAAPTPAAPAPVAQATPASCPKVRVVYAGYVSPAAKAC